MLFLVYSIISTITLTVICRGRMLSVKEGVTNRTDDKDNDTEKENHSLDLGTGFPNLRLNVVLVKGKCLLEHTSQPP